MPTEVATQRAIELVRTHVPWWPVGAERVWLGLTTTDPADGILSEPDWPGYARQAVHASDVIRIRGSVYRIWCNAGDGDVTLHGWFATDDAGHVFHVRGMRAGVLYADDSIALCFDPDPDDHGTAVSLDALRETRS